MKHNQKKLFSRLNRIEGQVRGVKEMVATDRYCIDIITQISAIKSALSNFENELLKSHLSCCVIKQIEKGEKEKAIEEILKVYTLKRR